MQKIRIVWMRLIHCRHTQGHIKWEGCYTAFFEHNTAVHLSSLYNSVCKNTRREVCNLEVAFGNTNFHELHPIAMECICNVVPDVEQVPTMTRTHKSHKGHKLHTPDYWSSEGSEREKVKWLQLTQNQPLQQQMGINGWRLLNSEVSAPPSGLWWKLSPFHSQAIFHVLHV